MTSTPHRARMARSRSAFARGVRLVGLVAAVSGLAGSPASANLFPYFAISDGTVVSGPFAQALGLELVIGFDPTQCGLADAMIQQESVATYSVVPGATTTIRQVIALNIDGQANNLGLPPTPGMQPTVQNVTGITVDTEVSDPPTIVLGPFEARQEDLGLVPSGAGLYAATRAGAVTLDDVDTAPPGPPPAVVSNLVSQGPTPGVGENPMMADRIIGGGALHFASINGGPLTLYGFFLYDIDINDVATLTSNYDTAALLVTPTPDGFFYAGAGTLSRDFLLQGGDSIQFVDVQFARLKAEFTECVPEPSTLALSGLGAGLAALARARRRRRRPA